MNFKHSIGMRTIKTGLAIIATLYLAQSPLITNPFYAVIGCVFGIQNTVKNSFDVGRIRILGTILGGTMGFLFSLIPFKSPLMIGLAVILTIYACNVLKLNTAIPVSVTILCSILLGITDQDPLVYSVIRTIDTTVGIIVALLINYYIVQPKFLNDLVEEIQTIEKLTIDFVKQILIHQSLETKALKTELKRLDTLFQNYRDDTRFDKEAVELDALRVPIDACHQIYFHAKCIAFLSEEHKELSPKNTMQILNLFNTPPTELLMIELEQPINPIFEYHISKMIEEIIILNDSVLCISKQVSK